VVTIIKKLSLNNNKQTKESNLTATMKNVENNLEVLKKSLESLKMRYLANVNSENKFAVQNKEYVIGLLKQIA
jgi:hypothetical protein